MALAMSWVSKVPAAPTTVPAMIMAALSSTKPSKPTARPVSALYSEITTGMSAPPIGNVIATPRSSANPKNNETAGRPSNGSPKSMPETTMNPSATVTSNMAKFRNFWPPKRTDLVIKPCSFAKAIKLPLNDTEPMKPPMVAMVRCVMLCSLPRYNSTAAMAAAAPPPMPLYSAIICGMLVMATRLPLTQASMPPAAMAPIMSIKLTEDAPDTNANVTAVASSMPAPAQRTPLTAVTGELMRFRPRMNSAAATR